MFIPLRIRILHLFGRTSFIIGFIFSIIGLSFIAFFSFQINWRLYFAGKNDMISDQAIITGFQETKYSVNDNPLFNYNYKYSDSSDSSYFGNFLEFEWGRFSHNFSGVNYMFKLKFPPYLAGKFHHLAFYDRPLYTTLVIGNIQAGM